MEIAKREVEIAERPAPTVLEIIAAVAQDPRMDVSKLERLLELQERIQGKEAAAAFATAMKAAQDEMPVVFRDSENESNRSRYAKLEKLDAKIRPVYAKHGFSLSFSGAEPKVAGNLRVVCKVMHTGGHSEEHELEGGMDTTGAKGGATKTAIQGLGSSASYLRRYLTLMIFNVMLSNEDNDGQNDYLTDEQAMQVNDMCNLMAMKGETMQQFLMFAGAPSISKIQKFRYAEVMAALTKRHNKLREEGKL